jgi:hypothetical protein
MLAALPAKWNGKDELCTKIGRCTIPGHAVSRPKHMTCEELEAGYQWCYQRLFSSASIWNRRPAQAFAVLPYLAMSYHYKRSNYLWYYLIRFRLTALGVASACRIDSPAASQVSQNIEESTRTITFCNISGGSRHPRRKDATCALFFFSEALAPLASLHPS